MHCFPNAVVWAFCMAKLQDIYEWYELREEIYELRDLAF